MLYASEGRPSIPPEQLLSALLLQVFYGIRSERQLMEQLDYNHLYRWFVGLQDRVVGMKLIRCLAMTRMSSGTPWSRPIPMSANSGPTAKTLLETTGVFTRLPAVPILQLAFS
jgi:Transposase domain (DUF772)